MESPIYQSLLDMHSSKIAVRSRLRFALRNQHKISDAYSPEALAAILESLKAYFDDRTEISDTDCEYIEGDRYPYKTLIINEVDHTVNMIAFYVIGQKYNVLKLAFKEFIG